MPKITPEGSKAREWVKIASLPDGNLRIYDAIYKWEVLPTKVKRGWLLNDDVREIVDKNPDKYPMPKFVDAVELPVEKAPSVSVSVPENEREPMGGRKHRRKTKKGKKATRRKTRRSL